MLNKSIYILSDSQAAIKALDKHQIISKLVWDCHQSLTKLARHNRVQIIWVPGHEGIVGNVGKNGI
jgi:ribonuclease HI